MTATATKKAAVSKAPAPSETPVETAEAAVEEQTPDLDVILPSGGRIEVDGIKAEVGRLKSREFLLLMRVLTAGLGEGIRHIRLSPDDEDELESELIALFMLAIPNAIEEFGEFLMAIVEPVESKDDLKLRVAMQNPDPEVLIDIFGIMVEQEKDDLSALLGKGRAWIARLQKTFQPPPPTG